MSLNYLRNALKNYHENCVQVQYHKKNVGVFCRNVSHPSKSNHGRNGQTSQRLLNTSPTLSNLGSVELFVTLGIVYTNGRQS